MQGSWILVIPTLVGLGMAAIALPLATARQKNQLYQTVELLIAMTQDNPAADPIALEELKQGENPDARTAIDRWVQELEHKTTSQENNS